MVAWRLPPIAHTEPMATERMLRPRAGPEAPGTLPSTLNTEAATSPNTQPACPTALHVLTTLLSQAAFSSRFATLVSPVPCPERFVDAATGEVRIGALRAALAALPAEPPPSAASRPAECELLAAHELLADLRARAAVLAPATGTRAGVAGPRLRRYTVTHAAEGGRSGLGDHGDICQRFEAFHGSAVPHWWGILNRGLEVTPDDPATVETGRVYGQGVYCAERYTVAAGFAPVVVGEAQPPGWGGIDSVVGVFEVFEDSDGVVVRRHSSDPSLPEGYVVAGDAAFIRLVELVVSVPPVRRRKTRIGEQRGDGGGIWAVFGDSSWVAVLILAYAIGLVAIGTDISPVGRGLWRLLCLILGRRG